MPSLHLPVALWMLPIYCSLTLLIGWLARRKRTTAADYLNASRSLPLWVVTLAFLASNCNALDILGLNAMAAQYGVQAFHFFWIGAIPAMVFLALVMMPVYRRNGVSSVPEYLLLRYGPSARLLNAGITALVLLMLCGISLYALAEVLQVMGVGFNAGLLCCAGVVLAYVLTGGVRATIYNEVLQLALIVAALVPLAFRTAAFAGRSRLAAGDATAHLWTSLPLADTHAPMDVAGVAIGLGCVLSFGYWCTDFVLMQRAFAARTESAAQQVPLWAGFGKLAFSLVVVLPGLAAVHLLPAFGSGHRFDQTLPALMRRQYGPAMLSLGSTALTASLMAGLAGKVSAFASVVTEDIYRTAIATGRSEEHYIRVGRCSMACAVLLGAFASYGTFLFKNLMEHMQFLFSIFGSPFWAIFLLGITTRRTTEKGALAGFAAGSLLALAHGIAVMRGWLHYGSTMSANFYAAAYAFGTASVVALAISVAFQRESAPSAVGLTWQGAMRKTPALLWVLSAALLVCCALLNLFWR